MFYLPLTRAVIATIQAMTGLSYDAYLSRADAREKIAADLRTRVAVSFPEGQTFSLEIALSILREEVTDHIARLFGKRIADEANNRRGVHVDQEEVDKLIATALPTVIAERGERLAAAFIKQSDEAA